MGIQEGLSFSPELCPPQYQNSETYRRVFLCHQNCVPDHTKIQGHTGGFFFFTRIVSSTVPKFRDIQEGFSFSPELFPRPYQNSGTYRRVFLFHQNCVLDRTKIQGHTGGSFFFTRIVSPTVPKFRDIQEGLSFSPELCPRPYQNSGTYRRVFLCHQNCVPDRTKIQGHTGGSFFVTRIVSPTVPKFRDIQEGLSLSPELCPRPYQNSGTHRRVFLFHQNCVPDRTKIQGHTGGSFFFTRIV